MQDHPVIVLCEIVQLAPDIASDPRRCRSLLNDHLRNGYRKEVNLLVLAIETGVTRILQGSSGATGGILPETHRCRRAIERLESETGLKPPESVWAVEAWANAIGLEPNDLQSFTTQFDLEPSSQSTKSGNSFVSPVPEFSHQVPKLSLVGAFIKRVSNSIFGRSVVPESRSARISLNPAVSSPCQTSHADRLSGGISVQPKQQSQLKHEHFGRQAGERWLINLDHVEIPLRWCPPGTFTMGSPRHEKWRCVNEEEVEVRLTSGFWIMETEVSQELYQEVTGVNPSAFKGSGPLPVENVSAHDADRFCEQITQMLRQARVIPSEYVVALPSEAEWEYSCRSGANSKFEHLDHVLNLSEKAWFSFNSDMGTHRIGEKLPNGWGLRDLLGNVWEWCADSYVEILPGGVDPCIVGDGARVNRGGSFRANAAACRPAYRRMLDPSFQSDDLGFRFVVVPENARQTYTISDPFEKRFNGYEEPFIEQPRNIREQVADLLRRQPGLSARGIARTLGVDKKEVNAILYRHLWSQMYKDEEHRWWPRS